MSFSIVLFDDCPSRERLLPLVATRPVGNLRVGIYTLNQKWQSSFSATVSYHTVPYLRSKFPLLSKTKEILYIKASVLPSQSLVAELSKLEVGEKLISQSGDWIAVKFPAAEGFTKESLRLAKAKLYEFTPQFLNYPEDIYIHNATQIAFDLQFMSIKPLDADLGEFTSIGKDIYVDSTAKVRHCVLDASSGPIYIGAGAFIEPGVTLYGPVAVCAGSRVKSGSLIYGNVTIGDGSTVCGELNNTVIWGRSAKGHLGYLGCAVLGEGCNLGAGTSNSNLRNDWKSVQLYNYETRQMRDTNQFKCGVIIGDHAMLGIHSKINTGTVIGVGAQIAISNFIPKFVQDFSWLTDTCHDRYIFARFIEMMKRKASIKKEPFYEEDELILASIYKEITKEKINQH